MAELPDVFPEQRQYGSAEGSPVEFYLLEIAGFGRRVGAFVFDFFLLGTALLILGLIFQDFFYASGPDGRVYGFGIVVAYFTLFSSSLGRGQTFGKRLLKIGVVDAQGRFLTVRRSFFRSSALFIMFLLNQWSQPVFFTSLILGIVAGTVVLGGLLSLLYNVLFNRATRQGSHDLLVGSYVVRVPETQAVVFTVPTQRPLHVQITLGLFGLGLVISSVSFWYLGKTDLVHAAKALNQENSYFSVDLSHSLTSDVLSIHAWYEKDLSFDTCVEMAQELVKTTFDEYQGIDKSTALDVVVFKQMDLGFSFRFETLCSISASVEDWRRGIEAASFFNQGVEFFQNEDYTAAVEAFTQAITIRPAYSGSYGNRGLAYMRLGQYDLALQDLYRYRDMSPKEDLLPDILALIAQLEKSTGKTQ